MLMKKILPFLFLIFFLNSNKIISQNEIQGRTCGTPIPSKEWDEWFNGEVEKFKLKNQHGKGQMVNYTIPVVVHIIHAGGAVGAGDNVSQAQIVDQINIMNNDFAGTGVNVGNVPAPFAPLVANTNITWCLAITNPTGGVLAEPGIDRIPATNIPGITGVPGSGFTMAQINNTIKPATIWDPVRYCNVWILKLQNGLLGYATFPAGTSLPGVAGGGSATNDGIVVGHNYFGSVGTATAPPYNLGRTAGHELGHWLGLRHVWGDGNCLTDFCDDTPWAKQANYGCPTPPAFVNRCGAGQSPNGEMTMNIMDYTDDPCMYMFSNDQRTRMQTAMSQGTYRNLLGTHGLCVGSQTVAPGPAVANFTIIDQPCIGTVFSPSNTSTGGPAPSFTWSSFPPANFSPNVFAASPGITFPSAGNYTLTLTASNSVATSSYSMAIISVTTCPKQPKCLDTLKMLTNIDTLTTYIAPTNTFVSACQSGFTGFLSGTNCYKDQEFGQFFPLNTYSDTPLPQVNSVIVLFNKNGTKSTPTTSATQIYCKVYGGTIQNGPGAQLAVIGDSLGKIAAITPTNQVQYCGNPNYIFTNTIVLAHKFNFAAPVIIPTSGFYAAVAAPNISPVDSINIFSSIKTNLNNDSSAWVLLSVNNWRTMRYQRSAKIQLAIMPQITCRPVVGINDNSALESNILIMPNPSSGLFNLVCTFDKSEKIKINIYNSIGQKITDTEFENVRNNVFDIDLSSKAEGIYFIEISNGNEKLLKKLIISK